MSKKKIENQKDDFMRREKVEMLLEKKRKESLLKKEWRIQQIIDEAIIHNDKKGSFFDGGGEPDPIFDIKIDIKEAGSIKTTIQKKDLDIFELKLLVENLDSIDQSINLLKLKEKREKESIKKG